MDNNEELRRISNKIADLDDTVSTTNWEIKNLERSIKNSSPKGIIEFIFFVSVMGVLGAAMDKHTEDKRYDKAIIYNDNNAVIFDITESNSPIKFDDVKDGSVIYVDEDQGISANDIAVTLVGEDGCVYYYSSETKEKELVNKK